MKGKWWGGVAAVLAAGLFCSASARAQSVVTYHNAPDRSGEYVVPGLSLTAAAGLHLDTAFHAAISGNVYAQPLYWAPSAGPKLLIVATESNLVYGLNADSGAEIWKTQLPVSVPRSALPCGDINPEGITGTPVIDPASGTLYLDALVLASGNVPRHRIYALSAATGKILPHWPLDVDSAAAKLGNPFDSAIQGERSALLFFGGRIYVAYSGRAGDCKAYRGVVIEVTPSATPALTANWVTRALRGGIWAQAGVTSDGKSLYATTGNTAGADTFGDGESVVRLAAGLARPASSADYFAPTNWKAMDQADADLGSTSAIPIAAPGTGSAPAARILGFGKDGHAYLLDATNLGGIGSGLLIEPVSNSRIVTAPAVYNTPKSTLVVFTDRAGRSANCSGNSLTMLRVTADAANPIAFAWCAVLNGYGSPIITTTNGAAAGIVWVTGAEGDNDIHGFNALNGKTVFAGTGTAMTGLHRYGTLIAANHHLYVAADGTVYGFTF
jgi:hypothetical protein